MELHTDIASIIFLLADKIPHLVLAILEEAMQLTENYFEGEVIAYDKVVVAQDEQVWVVADGSAVVISFEVVDTSVRHRHHVTSA